MFERYREYITGGWTILQNESFYNLYSSPKYARIIRENEMGGE
jgi:hypothetical protein